MKGKVLIASNDRYSNILLSDYLSKKFDVSVVDNGKDAYGLLTSGKIPDLLICDYMLPEIDGLTLIKCLKRDYKFSSLRTLIITSVTFKDIPDKWIGGEVDYWIEKPYNLKAIDVCIEKVLKR